jgi:hypothetical protein
MMFMAAVLALFLVLIGIGGGLGMTGYRGGNALMLWAGVAILIVVLGFVALEALVTVACWAGAGCI